MSDRIWEMRFAERLGSPASRLTAYDDGSFKLEQTTGDQKAELQVCHHEIPILVDLLMRFWHEHRLVDGLLYVQGVAHEYKATVPNPGGFTLYPPNAHFR